MPLLPAVLASRDAIPSRTPHPSSSAFRAPPPDRLATWQIDISSLRRSLIRWPGSMSRTDLVSGIITSPEKRSPSESLLARRSKICAPDACSLHAERADPDISAVPARSQFCSSPIPAPSPWTSSIPRTNLRKGGPLSCRAPWSPAPRQIVVSGHASATGADLVIDAPTVIRGQPPASPHRWGGATLGPRCPRQG